LDIRLDELESERSRLRVILENMVEGVILCSSEGEIILWNEAFQRMFDTPGPTGKKLIEAIRIPEVIKLSNQVMRDRLPHAVEFQSGNASIQATFVPLGRSRAEGYLAVFHDITDLKRADRIRRDFVANVSHELRTPLASISGYGESLLDGAIDDPAVARPFVEGVVRNAERLSLLIEDVLDLARIESGRYPFEPESIDLHSLVASSAQVVSRLESKEQKFSNLVPAGLTVWADRKAASQILVNLIENAAKYTPHGTDIRVKASLTGAMTEITVEDTGPGIPPDDLPRIFERFYRGDKSRNAAGQGGTGLGLAICKHLATEMGGSIAAASSGRGTVITLRLPHSSPPARGIAQ
jgi:two-component system phosphate regulon sensor histidine kinase PhoR